MWSQFAADARAYSALRWPGNEGALRRALIWIRSPALLMLTLHRINQRYLARRAQKGWTTETILLRILLALGRRPIAMLTKSDVDDGVEIGGGVYLSDHGCLIVGPQYIGSGTVIHERVTIGARAGGARQPVIGENVWIGRDCVIYGDVSIGDGAAVLPGSVVSMNVPARAVVGGNPAIIVRRQFDNAALRRTLSGDVDAQSLASK